MTAAKNHKKESSILSSTIGLKTKMDKDKITIGIIGARSLTSGLLIKLLLHHKYVIISMLLAEAEGVDIQKEHPFLKNLIDKKTETYDAAKIIETCNLVFLHKQKEGIEKTAELLELAKKNGKRIKVIDLSADFRLKDAKLYDQWYGFTHLKPALLEESVYGLTELYREKIKNATIVANPGCYPTAILLEVAPLLKNNFVDDKQTIIIDAYSGVSGAGKTKNGSNLAFDVEQNIIPYKIGRKHQHVPEIEQELNNMNDHTHAIVFSPHVVPFKYGILATSYLKLKEPYEWEHLHSAFKELYKHEPFIRILNKEEVPQISSVEGTNFCDIGFSIDTNSQVCIVMCAIDNVIKGASGQAIQNMNVMYGFDETEGLPFGQVLSRK